jgi:hypothetical protein
LRQFHSCETIRDVKKKIASFDKLENDADRELLLNIAKYALNEVDKNHEWSVQWKKIRGIIVLGNDKHDLF